MITRSLITCACVLATLHPSSAAPVTYADGKLDNGIVTVAFEAQGSFTIQDAKTGDVLLSDARFALPWGRTGNVESITVADLADELGTGKRVMHTEERPAYLAKNRYELPETLPLDWSEFVKAMPQPK